MLRSRPKRTGSNNVDYNLRKSKIIKEEDGGRSAKRPRAAAEEERRERTAEACAGPVIQEVGGATTFYEPGTADPVNGVTGLRLSELPGERVKREALGNGRQVRDIPREAEERYQRALVRDADGSDSFMRSALSPQDVHAAERARTAAARRPGLQPRRSSCPTVSGNGVPKQKRIKAIKDPESKLFGQNSTANHVHIPELRSAGANIENDDFCSSCMQTGIFLCCDTCPKSFHFACLNPPLDPDRLPEGDWSCHECRFKQMYPTKAAAGKAEKRFLAEHQDTPGISLFGKLLFQLQSMNSKQFGLAPQIKDTFANVHTGPHGEYQDDTMKEPLSDKQLFNVPYGQSVTKFDSYNPDTHFENPDESELLICYKCNTTRMGTWDHPETERLIMKCDYCNTPWHLDCLPVPRASRKNLGSKWKCPLHAIPPYQKRRLAKGQEYVLQPLGAYNDGDVEIELDTTPIEAEIGKDMQRAWENGRRFNNISLLQEQNVKLEFLDKVYRAKQAQRTHELREETILIEKMHAPPDDNKTKSWLYFSLPEKMRKLWDFQELCVVADKELKNTYISPDEIKQLQLLKRLLESKPRKDVFSFLGLDN
ncbi:FAGL075Cp [Eremothecium gossypii FDAG1]|nr:FAGL075Cp [Eremothecium gossypii FDAG1]